MQPDRLSLSMCCSGPNLLDLHGTALQEIAKHFQADEWAKVPGQACRLLRMMHLPCMDLTIPHEEVDPLLTLCRFHCEKDLRDIQAVPCRGLARPIETVSRRNSGGPSTGLQNACVLAHSTSDCLSQGLKVQGATKH